MTLLNPSMKRSQILQRVKELAREGQWQEAKVLIDTLPSTPDIDKIRTKIEKQLFIATGEVPAVMEGSMALQDAGAEGGQPIAQPLKAKTQPVPEYYVLVALHLILFGISAVAAAVGVVQLVSPPYSYEIFGSYYTVRPADAAPIYFAAAVMFLISGEICRVYRDIARNSWRATHALERLLDIARGE